MRIQINSVGRFVDGRLSNDRRFKVFNQDTGLEISHCLYADDQAGIAIRIRTNQHGVPILYKWDPIERMGSIRYEKVKARIRIEELHDPHRLSFPFDGLTKVEAARG